MIRKILLKKLFKFSKHKHGSILIRMFIRKLLKQGKLKLARMIVLKVFQYLGKQLKRNNKMYYRSAVLFETAIKNCMPRFELKTIRLVTDEVTMITQPTRISTFRGLNISLRWLVQAAKKKRGGNIAKKLALIISEAAQGFGAAIRKRIELHQQVEAYKINTSTLDNYVFTNSENF